MLESVRRSLEWTSTLTDGAEAWQREIGTAEFPLGRHAPGGAGKGRVQ